MPESSIVVRPEPPDSPTYSASSRLQAAGLQSAIDLFVKAAEVVPIPKPPRLVVIADYGAANGHNSLLPITGAVGALRTRMRKEQGILIAHTDIADNDFGALFHMLADDPDSYLRTDDAVFAAAVGRSFYQQILPSRSVTLAWTSWAIHWLSRLPVAIPDHVLPAYSADPAVHSACARQAAEDWHDFVAFRGRELVDDGRLVVLTMGVDETGKPGLRPLVDSVYAALGELADTGLITSAELRDMSIPIIGRSVEDFVAPFAPKGRLEGLSVESLEVFDAEDRFWQQYQLHQSADAFGAAWAAFLRVAVFPALLATLERGAADPRSAEFSDRLEGSVAERLSASPQRMSIPLAKAVLVKNSHTG